MACIDKAPAISALVTPVLAAVQALARRGSLRSHPADDAMQVATMRDFYKRFFGTEPDGGPIRTMLEGKA